MEQTKAVATPPLSSSHHLPPQVKGGAIIRSLPALMSDIYEQLVQNRERYGDAYTLNLGVVKVVILNHPRHVEHVMVRQGANYGKGGPLWDTMRGLLGNGLVVSEGDFWLRQRRMMQPQFHRKRMDGLAQLMTEAITESMAAWEAYAQSGEPVNMSQEFPRITMNVIVKTMFGTGITNEEADQVGEALTFALDYIMKGVVVDSLPKWIPAPGRQQYQAAVAAIDEIVARVIERCRERDEEAADLITLLFHMVDEETGGRMTNEQLRDEAVTLFLAGYETTATALMWALHLLPQHPDVLQKMRQEVDEVLGDRTPTFADVGQLAYTKMVMQEVLRLYPPAWWFMRTAAADDEIDGYHIPAGTIVAPVPYTVHRHPDIWDDPEAFIPERFSKEEVEQRHRYAWVPFGAGQRLCIGRDFALMEGQFILAHMVRHYQVHAVPDHTPQRKVSTTIRSKDGIYATVSKRA